MTAGGSQKAGVFVFALVVATSLFSVAAIAGGCGTDDASPASDAGADTNASDAPKVALDGSDGADGAIAALTAHVDDGRVYLGQTAALVVTIAPASSATYAWELTQAPNGSALTTKTLG